MIIRQKTSEEIKEKKRKGDVYMQRSRIHMNYYTLYIQDESNRGERGNNSCNDQLTSLCPMGSLLNNGKWPLFVCTSLS